MCVSVLCTIHFNMRKPRWPQRGLHQYCLAVDRLFLSPSSYALHKQIQCLQTRWKTRRSSIRLCSTPLDSLQKSCFSVQTVLKSAPILPQNNYGFRILQADSASVSQYHVKELKKEDIAVAMPYHENGGAHQDLWACRAQAPRCCG